MTADLIFIAVVAFLAGVKVTLMVMRRALSDSDRKRRLGELMGRR